MVFNEIFTCVLIVLGGIIMFPAMLKTKQILSLLKEGKYIRVWQVLFALIVFFMVGYLAILYFVLAKTSTLLISLTGVVLFFGALYVYFVVQTGYLTIDNLLETNISRNYLDNILTSVIDTLIVITPNGTVQTVNQAACDLLGYTEEELIGRPMSSIFAEDTSEGADIDSLIRKGSAKHIEQTYLTKNGEKVPVLFSGSAMLDDRGKIQGIVCIAQDITERRRAEETLRESEDRHRNLIESSYDLIQSVMDDGHFGFVNKTWFETLGYTEAELPDLTLFDIVHPDFHPHCEELFQKIMSGESFKHMEITLVTKDGRLIPVEGNATGRFMGDEFVATYAFFRDITERKAAEKLSEEYRRNLEQKVEERTQELKERNDALENTLNQLKNTQTQLVQSEKMAALGHLAAGVAHEINNPVGVVNSIADVSNRCINRIMSVLETSDTLGDIQDNEQFQQSIKLLKENNRAAALASDRIGEIVGSLRDFARLDESEFQNADIHEGIDSTLTLINNRLRGLITVHKDFGEIPRILCYPGQLNQVILNLLTNAVDAIDGEGDVWIRTFLDGDSVKISIQDNGRGIPEDMLPNIFDPFFTTRSAGSGTGLGLAVSYQVIEQHGGKIEVESEIGKGAEFVVTLPVKAPVKSGRTIV